MPTSTTTEPHQAVGYRVLFVDDDFNWRAVMRILLEEKGYEVETAEDGREAWLRICAAMRGTAKGYDIVVTDLDMPRLDGMELIRMIRKVGFAIRLLVYTGKLSPARRIVLEALSVDAAVEKGMESDELLNLIGNIAKMPGGN